MLCLTGCTKSAERVEEGNFIIEGEKYIAISIGYTKKGKTIAKADGFDIMEIPEDKDHTFLAVRSGLDNWTIVKESYKMNDEYQGLYADSVQQTFETVTG